MQYETVVIGAGQAGLSAGYHLAKRGKPFVILDAADRVGGSWLNRWDSLRIESLTEEIGKPFGVPRSVCYVQRAQIRLFGCSPFGVSGVNRERSGQRILQ